MEAKRTNSSAFPVTEIYHQSGMTMLAYFVCHAPARPHWFEPIGLPEKPVAKFIDDKGNPASQLHTINPETQRLRQNILENKDEFSAWDREYEREKEFQWPMFWAKTMLDRLGYAQ